MHLLLQGFAVVRWTVENTWLRWNQKYLIRSVCRELMRTASPVDIVAHFQPPPPMPIAPSLGTVSGAIGAYDWSDPGY